MATTYFCTKADIIRYLSQDGVIGFSDHEETGAADDDVIDDCRTQASEEIAGVLEHLYTVANLATSALVTRWATVIASYYLCERRGNPVPDSLAAEYERLTAFPDGLLYRTRSGKFALPGIRKSTSSVPVFSNLTVDRRYLREKVRVIRANSSNIPTAIEQDTAREINTDN